MAEQQLYEGVKITGWGVDHRSMQEVWIWDCGPEKPKAPERPKTPKGAIGEPEYDLAMIEFKEALEKYADDLKTYGAKKKEHAEFESRNGGPVEMVQWSCDARDTFRYDAEAVRDGRQMKPRYHLSSRTRGHEKLPNLGLPDGVRPGKGQEENLRRLAESNADLYRARQRDPVFGQELRQ